MKTISYNDMQFAVEPQGGRWDIAVTRWDGTRSLAGTGLFAGLSEAAAGARALNLIRILFPVGVRCVGPDVAHPNTIGDLKIVGPDVAHPTFIYWNRDSVSSPRQA